MPLLLYINGKLLDLEPNQVIAQTRQVNDLNSLENRQASYTNKFKVPKTAHNIRALEFLTLTGTGSNVPYKKNECCLYSDGGECFVYNGWAVVTDGGNDFEVVVYDGIISLYKAIENKMLSEVTGIDILDHDKTLENITASWNPVNNLPYRYILADYNGKPVISGILPYPAVNIDYQVPSVNVAWLWDKIFTSHNFSYSGAVFNSENFTNLWMTYPKGVTTADEGTDICNSIALSIYNPPEVIIGEAYWRTLLVKIIPGAFDPELFDYDFDFHKLRVKQAGYYKVSLSGTVNSNESVKIFICRNLTATSNTYLNGVSPFRSLTNNQEEETEFEHETRGFYLEEGDSISLLMRHTDPVDAIRFGDDEEWSLDLALKKVNVSDINFTEAFADFSIRDFLSEIVHRFGLTLYKDRYNNHYEFLTLQELLYSRPLEDWSDKFIKKVSENYIYGNYAQRNWFRYNYNDKESSHNDGYIDVANVNLPPSRDVIKSKIYSPEKYKTTFLSRPANTYKLWEKEVTEDPQEGEDPVSYKPLDKRYYFLRAVPGNQTVILFSEELEGNETVAQYWTDNYWKLSFGDIVQDYYFPIKQVLDKAVIINAEMWLKDRDVANFDFSKLYYIKQLSSYFIMNKINNYIPGKPVKCELVQVDYNPAATPPLPIKINKVVITQYSIAVHFTLNVMESNIMLQVFGYGSPGVWSNTSWPAVSPVHFSFTPPGTFPVRIRAGNNYSNTVEVTIPSNQTIEIP